MSIEHALLRRVLPFLVQLGDHTGNGPIDPSRPGSLGARCDLIGDIQAILDPLLICERCGAEVSDAQAGLSHARGENAPAWCADCVTADLTQQQAHRATDPHCTCNDCMVDLL